MQQASATPSLVRSQNPLQWVLNDSQCRFQLRFAKSGPQMPAALIENWRSHGGKIIIDQTDTFNDVKLTISHGQVDAFGGMMICSQASLGESAELLASAEQPFIDKTDGITCFHTVWQGQPDLDQQTFTQKFLSDLIGTFDHLANKQIGLAIALDDVRLLQPQSLWGNSLGLVAMRGDRLARLCKTDKESWRAALLKRAELSLRLSSQTSEPMQVLLSSISDVRRLPWVKGLNPHRFVMIPTPNNRECMNIVTWSDGLTQGLALAFDGQHFLQKDRIVKIWREMFS